jgi:hypothetical protein
MRVMKTPHGKECKYYYADYHRGRNTQECRLLQPNPASAQWKPALCQTCPVPGILIANACPNFALRARVGKSFFGLLQKIEIEAACREYRVEVKKPHVGCGKCQPIKLNAD